MTDTEQQLPAGPPPCPSCGGTDHDSPSGRLCPTEIKGCGCITRGTIRSVCSYHEGYADGEEASEQRIVKRLRHFARCAGEDAAKLCNNLADHFEKGAADD